LSSLFSTLSLHDALPICVLPARRRADVARRGRSPAALAVRRLSRRLPGGLCDSLVARRERRPAALRGRPCRRPRVVAAALAAAADRKSTRLNSSHEWISY